MGRVSARDLVAVDTDGIKEGLSGRTATKAARWNRVACSLRAIKLRQRSKTNSRPAEDLSIRRRYANENPNCELSIWFCEHFQEQDGHDIHHIFGGTSGRHDLLSNLVRVSRDAHEWCERWKFDGRVLCLWVKHVKDELDPEEVRKASGSYLAGWLTKSEATHDFVQVYLKRLRKLYP